MATSATWREGQVIAATFVTPVYFVNNNSGAQRIVSLSFLEQARREILERCE